MINGGAKFTENPNEKDARVWHPILTKKELKELLKEKPKQVLFYATSFFDEGLKVVAANIAPGQKWVIVGPDPYKERNWYAQVDHLLKVK